MSWSDYPGLAAPLCVVCCQKKSKGCDCELAIYVKRVFDSYDIAAYLLGAYALDCIFFYNIDTDVLPPPSTISFVAGTFSAVVNATTTDPDTYSLFSDGYVSLNLKGGSTLQVDYSLTSDGTGGSDSIMIVLFTCDYVEVFSAVYTTATGTQNISVPDDGEYVLQVVFEPKGATSLPSFTDCEITVTCDEFFSINPVVALWDDSGTTRKLQACPKLLIPFRSETSHDVYANESDAQAVLDSEQVSNCVGFHLNSDVDTFEATDTGSTLTLHGYLSTSADDNNMAGSVNAIGGATISMDYNTAITGVVPPPTPAYAVFMNVYDVYGVLVSSKTAVVSATDSGTLVSDPMPCNGKYSIECDLKRTAGVISGTPTSDAVFVLTSSDTMTVNPVQALYAGDPSSNCPATLDCDDLP